MFPIRDTQPSYSKPYVTILLIVINMLIFLYEFSLSPYSRDHFIATYGMVPDEFSFFTLLTSMFLHGGWMHVLGNMWFLWIFGDNIEDTLGHGKYLLFYIACGMIAGLAQFIVNPTSRVPTVGASGAIAGVLGGYLVLYPTSRIGTLIGLGFIYFPARIYAWAFIVFWFLLQLVNGVASIGTNASAGGGVAYWAHVGGFLTGVVLVRLFAHPARVQQLAELEAQPSPA